MVKGDESHNLRLQSEHHPLVPVSIDSREAHCLSLIHRKAYARAAQMARGLKVLDIGCNNGYGTMIIARQCASIVGVDVSKRAIESALSEHWAPNIEYKFIDGTSLPFSDASFDLVTSFQVIEHIEVVEPYLREIRRVMRKNGTALFTTPNRCIRLQPGAKPWNPFHVREYDSAELASALRTVFSVVSVEGLFAARELYQIEIERVRTARSVARRSPSKMLASLRTSARTAVIKSAKGILPQWGVDGLRKLTTGRAISIEASERAELADFISRWTLADLFYRNDNLDEALDLIAICSNGNPKP